eukprot:1196303-Pleurochrysis_carterae.AAC.2
MCATNLTDHWRTRAARLLHAHMQASTTFETCGGASFAVIDAKRRLHLTHFRVKAQRGVRARGVEAETRLLGKSNVAELLRVPEQKREQRRGVKVGVSANTAEGVELGRLDRLGRHRHGAVRQVVMPKKQQPAAAIAAIAATAAGKL